MVTLAAASSGVSPARASAYARRPATLIALNAGGPGRSPRNRASAASTAARSGAGPGAGVQLALQVVGGRARAEADRRAVALGRRGGTRRRAWRGRGRSAAPRPRTDRGCRHARPAASPTAGGPAPRRRARSGPPAWRRPGPRRGPAAAGRARLTAQPRRPAGARRLGQHDRSRPRRPAAVERGARGTRVTPTAERARQHGRVHAAGLGADADARVRRAGLLEQDGDLGGLGLRQEVDDPLGVRAERARRRVGRRRAGSTRRRVHRASVSRRASTRPKSRSCASGLVR